MSANFDAKGYYQVLEVTPNAPLSLIKQQYYSRAKFWHPDHNDNPDAVEENFGGIQYFERSKEAAEI